ncbi:hypothetical protein [Dielma fastidiosa]|uniref:Uncharacterized protein n=1 Tax=Dielma fastidiosa TaxID=1034346 RepID=A0A318KZ00_9FIRM|nr:hypothetical protein [Dielma fastidiosa]PXX78463.1 hypothetical protein DES51_1073 [Dielma fastidiosa]
MNWKSEKDLLIDEEDDLRRYVRGELMNYYLYLHKWHVLESKRQSLKCSSGGSVIQMPDGASDGKSPQQRMMDKDFELQELQEPFEKRMRAIDRWVSVLTKPYYNVIKEYVMKNRCRNPREVGFSLKLSEEAVRKQAERAICQICSRNKKIL